MRFIDRTGEVYNDLKITHELRGNQVIAECLKCGHQDKYRKNTLVAGGTACKGCGTSRKFVNRTGEVFNGIKITKELTGSKVEAICLNCGTVGIYTKSPLVNGKRRCKNCTLHGAVKDRTGSVYKHFKIVEELGGNRVKAICLRCGTEDVYKKNNLIAEGVVCGNCQPEKRRKSRKNTGLVMEFTPKHTPKYIECNFKRRGVKEESL